ncbi:MAG: ZIP family metal transporter [bacterium]|nr:ZIP family metal transporter [bacterium]
MILLISILASLAAFAGGAIALRFKDKLHIILGLSAGAVIGAALFDLIPEAIELSASVLHTEQVTALTAVGFLFYLILDRIFSFHTHNPEEIVSGSIHEHQSHARGLLGAASFSLHSLIDGIAIGLAFQASFAIGTVVAVAVIAHRFSDGINTVGIILKHYGNNNRRACAWLVVVGIAPIIGALLASLITVSDATLGIILAIFAGFFLYIGASDLIPEGHHSHSKAMTTTMTIVGAVALYLIVNLAHT